MLLLASLFFSPLVQPTVERERVSGGTRTLYKHKNHWFLLSLRVNPNCFRTTKIPAQNFKVVECPASSACQHGNTTRFTTLHLSLLRLARKVRSKFHFPACHIS